jgi:hypothetical protein
MRISHTARSKRRQPWEEEKALHFNPAIKANELKIETSRMQQKNVGQRHKVSSHACGAQCRDACPAARLPSK